MATAGTTTDPQGPLSGPRQAQRSSQQQLVVRLGLGAGTLRPDAGADLQLSQSPAAVGVRLRLDSQPQAGADRADHAHRGRHRRHGHGPALQRHELLKPGSTCRTQSTNDSLVQNASGTWTQALPDGFQIVLNSSSQLLRLASAAGDSWTLTYDGGGRPPPGRPLRPAHSARLRRGSNNVRRVQDSGRGASPTSPSMAAAVAAHRLGAGRGGHHPRLRRLPPPRRLRGPARAAHQLRLRRQRLRQPDSDARRRPHQLHVLGLEQHQGRGRLRPT